MQSQESAAGPASEKGHAERGSIVRNAIGIGVATGAYGISFGAIAAGTGLSVLQACALSLLMFTGASQFAFVGVIAAHGSPFAGAASAILLGSRNALYGLRLSRLLRLPHILRPLAAQVVIDESTAMAIGPESEAAGRIGFWSTGLAVFLFWNLGTLLGAIGARMLASPGVLGLDAAVPAAFLALLAPRLKARSDRLATLLGAAIAVGAVPFVPAGMPVLLAAAATTIFGLSGAGRDTPAVASITSPEDMP